MRAKEKSKVTKGEGVILNLFQNLIFCFLSCHSGLVSESRPLSFIRLCEKGAPATDAAISLFVFYPSLREA